MVALRILEGKVVIFRGENSRPIRKLLRRKTLTLDQWFKNEKLTALRSNDKTLVYHLAFPETSP